MCLVVATLGSAQERPSLPVGADTNDPAAYLELGRAMLRRSDGKALPTAEAAFHWAGRLDPGSAQSRYLMAVAVLQPTFRTAALPHPWARYNARRRLTRFHIKFVDSLVRQAWLREPFADIELEPLLVFARVPSPHLARTLEDRARFAYLTGDYRMALEAWGKALKGAPSRMDLRLHRAHTFHWLGQHDSTAAELRTALAQTERAGGDAARFLPATDALEYALGVTHERAGSTDSARAAYRRALVANLGLYMAHVRLAGLHLADADTVAAVEEVARAAGLAPEDPWVVAHYGSTLLRVGRPEDAIPWLASAIALDSAYSVPYFLLGVAFDELGRFRDALSTFEAFLDRAARKEDRRTWTTQRVAVLRAALADSAEAASR